MELSYDARAGQPRGLIRAIPPEGKFRHSRRDPPFDLQPWIEHVWHVSWDLRGCEPFQAQTLPHPNVHLTFECGAAAIQGVHTAMFERRLQDHGSVIGVKYRAGCFHPFFRRPVSRIRDQTIPARTVFGPSVDELACKLHSMAGGSEPAILDATFAFLRQHLPTPDPLAECATQCVATILKHPSIQSVELLAAATGMSKRSLQRLFTDYVGISAKWVIRRFRLFEVVAAVQSETSAPEWAAIAANLGYFDQSHMINDLRSITGYTPARLKNS